MALKRSGTARKAAKKSAAKAAKKTIAAKQVAAKKAVKKVASKKAVTKKAAAKKTVAKKASSKKTVAKKAASKKIVAKKAVARKPPIRKATTKTSPARKTAAKKIIAKKSPAPQATNAKKAAEVTLLSGGNPQIPKGFGNAPVKAYIAAMPGWKRKAGAHLDKLIERAVPQVYKAVKWNSPLYGIQGDGWFIGIHCFNEYIKVAFFRGASLNPPPPGPSTQKWVRYLNLRKQDVLDETQFMDWVKQASQLPGEKM